VSKDPSNIIDWYRDFTPDRQQRNSWYATVADTYDRLRPRYPIDLVERAFIAAKIPPDGSILEVGCGPGTATVTAAQLGRKMVCLEPSAPSCDIARRNTIDYPNVEIINTNFEDWQAPDRSFDAILAATSWHWIAPEKKHQQAAALLQDNGAIVMLWNTALQPPPQIFATYRDIFLEYIPALAKYKDRGTEIDEVRQFSKLAVASGLFTGSIEECRAIDVEYAIDDYLQLLTTYSPCIALSTDRRQEFLSALKVRLASQGDRLHLSYVSAFHVVFKV
jgi:SAM-dependent methyltransferase